MVLYWLTLQYAVYVPDLAGKAQANKKAGVWAQHNLNLNTIVINELVDAISDIISKMAGEPLAPCKVVQNIAWVLSPHVYIHVVTQ